MAKVFGGGVTAEMLAFLLAITSTTGASAFAQETVPQANTNNPVADAPTQIDLASPKPATPISPEKDSAGRPKAKAERIIVTGSRVKRIDAENAVPTKVLRQEDFNKAGVTSITELLQGMSENSFGSFMGGGNYVSVGQATLSLHGLGANRTLVLVNGRRLPVEASLGGTNINNIPLAMVDRVEILKSSAAAVYGADAIAGVINVILKKSVNGSEVATKANISQDKGGNSLNASAVTGFNLWDADFTIAVGGGRSERVLTRDRKQLWRAEPPYDKSAAGAPAGTYSWGLLNTAKPTDSLLAYVYHPSANCPVENQITLPNDNTNTQCRGDARKASTGELMPEKENRFLTLNMEKNFGDVAMSTTLLGSSVQTLGYESSRTLTSNPSRSGAYAIPFGQAPAALKAQAAAANLNYQDNQLIKINGVRLFPEVKGDTSTLDTSLGLIVAFQGPISSTWDWHIDASHFASKRLRNFTKAADRLAFAQKLFPVAATATPALNIFTDDLSSISGFFADLHSEEANLLTNATAYASGPVFELNGGSAVVAAGVSVGHEKYILRGDSKDSQFLADFPETAGILRARYLGSFASQGVGKRDVVSGFGELVMPFYKELDVSLTGRYDQYSDFGDTFNYGASVVGSPHTGLKFRANVGSGFRAPSLAEIYNRADGGYLTVRDEKYCNNSDPANNPCGNNGTSYSTYVNSPGNKDLGEEISLSYNLGMVLEPWDFYNVSIDYWSAKIDDIIGQEELDKLVEKDIKGESLGSSKINRGADDKIGSIDRSYANLGKMRSRGIDVASHLTLREGAFKYGLNTSYSRILTRKEKPTAVDPEQEYVGAFGEPRYRMTNSLFFDADIHSVSFDVTTIGRQESGRFDSDPDMGYISPENTYDVSYGWKYASSGTLSLGVYNIENRITSIYLTDRETRDVSFNRESADVRGRQFQIGVRQAF